MPHNTTHKKTALFTTLGCRLNQFETDALASQFEKNGWQVFSSNDSQTKHILPKQVDCSIINTCTITGKADRKSRNMINRSLRFKPKLTIITGCGIENYRNLKEKSDDPVFLVENTQKSSIFELVESFFAGNSNKLTQNLNDFLFESFPEDIFSYQGTAFHTRSAIKIQDGCDNYCSYCIIPYVRGRGSSRPTADILTEMKRMIESGTRDITLTGINISRYQWEDISFQHLLREILQLDGDFRLRLSSLEPDKLNDGFADILSHPKMSKHIHICLQSGSDAVLKRMRRMYSYDDFRKIIQAIRNKNPKFNITTDIITGFPGETDEEFAASLRAIEELQFGHVHIFPYSARKGTRAAKFQQLPSAVVKQRRERLQLVADKSKKSVYDSFIGSTQLVLIEQVNDSHFPHQASGYGEFYIPIRIEGQVPIKKNTFIQVKILESDKSGLLGKIISS